MAKAESAGLAAEVVGASSSSCEAHFIFPGPFLPAVQTVRLVSRASKEHLASKVRQVVLVPLRTLPLLMAVTAAPAVQAAKAAKAVMAVAVAVARVAR